MARLKGLLKSVVEDRSPRFLLGTIALGVVVSLLAGFAIGYKYEKSKGRKAAKAKVTKTTGTTTPGKGAGIKQAPILIGAVLRPKARALVIIGPNKKAISVTVGARTRFAVAKAGKAANITVGSRVLFQAGANATTATEVLVLPKSALLGTPVTAVKAGTSMSLKTLKGPDQVIKITGAKVDLSGPGSRRSAAQKTRVIVKYFLIGKKQTASAVQIVVLPAGSAFR
jgi:hypothetical protein